MLTNQCRFCLRRNGSTGHDIFTTPNNLFTDVSAARDIIESWLPDVEVIQSIENVCEGGNGFTRATRGYFITIIVKNHLLTLDDFNETVLLLKEELKHYGWTFSK